MTLMCAAQQPSVNANAKKGRDHCNTIGMMITRKEENQSKIQVWRGGRGFLVIDLLVLGGDLKR